MHISNSTEMKLVWERQFRFREAGLLNINHSFPTPWWNSVFSKGHLSSGCAVVQRATLLRRLSSFCTESMKNSVEYKTAAHHRCVRLISVRGRYNRHHQIIDCNPLEKHNVLERKQELYVMSILFVSVRTHFLIETCWGSLYFLTILNSNFRTILSTVSSPMSKNSHHSRLSPNSIILCKGKSDIFLHCYKTI